MRQLLEIYKRISFCFLMIAFLITPFLFTSCEQEPATTKRDRLTLFVVSLNSATRSGIEENFIGGSTADRAAFAVSLLPEGESYTWSESGSLSDKITGEFRKLSDSSYICTAEFFFENTQKNIFESEQWALEELKLWDNTLTIPNPFIYR